MISNFATNLGAQIRSLKSWTGDVRVTPVIQSKATITRVPGRDTVEIDLRTGARYPVVSPMKVRALWAAGKNEDVEPTAPLTSNADLVPKEVLDMLNHDPKVSVTLKIVLRSDKAADVITAEFTRGLGYPEKAAFIDTFKNGDGVFKVMILTQANSHLDKLLELRALLSQFDIESVSSYVPQKRTHFKK